MPVFGNPADAMNYVPVHRQIIAPKRKRDDD